MGFWGFGEQYVTEPVGLQKKTIQSRCYRGAGVDGPIPNIRLQMLLTCSPQVMVQKYGLADMDWA
jgi:hypothetical protein